MVDGCVLTSAARTNNGEHLATTDGYGRLRLVRYPAVNQGQVSLVLFGSKVVSASISSKTFIFLYKAWSDLRRDIVAPIQRCLGFLPPLSTYVSRCIRQGFREYRGHASPIRNCSFLVDDSSLLTSGGQDCILFLWNFEERADAEGAASNDDKGAQGLKLPESDVEVETLKLREERIHHPDLKDMSW